MSLDGRFVEQARRDLTALLAAHPELEHDDVLRMDMVEGSTNVMEMLDQLIQAEREACALANGIDGELERLTHRQARFEIRRVALRKYMMQLMEAAGLKKVERPAATVSIATGRPKVMIEDESLIPSAYKRTKIEVNKDLISKTLREERSRNGNGFIPGVTLSNAEPVLRIS